MLFKSFDEAWIGHYVLEAALVRLFVLPKVLQDSLSSQLNELASMGIVWLDYFVVVWPVLDLEELKANLEKLKVFRLVLNSDVLVYQVSELKALLERLRGDAV